MAGLGYPQISKRMSHANPRKAHRPQAAQDCQEPGHSPGWPQADVVTGLIGRTDPAWQAQGPQGQEFRSQKSGLHGHTFPRSGRRDA